MTSRKCEVCIVDVQGATHIKHLRSTKHTENMKQNELIIPHWLFSEPVENKFQKYIILNH